MKKNIEFVLFIMLKKLSKIGEFKCLLLALVLVLSRVMNCP